MRFSESEIQMAVRLRGAGLIWEPQPGHYVFDIDGVMKAGSPFQAGVYLITSPNRMSSQVGGDEVLQTGFAWLPTWEDARAWLTARGVDAAAMATALHRSMESGGTDREGLYGLMLEILDSPVPVDGVGA